MGKVRDATEQECTLAREFLDMRVYNFFEELIVEAEADKVPMIGLFQVISDEIDAAFADNMTENFPEE